MHVSTFWFGFLFRAVCRAPVFRSLSGHLQVTPLVRSPRFQVTFRSLSGHLQVTPWSGHLRFQVTFRSLSGHPPVMAFFALAVGVLLALGLTMPCHAGAGQIEVIVHANLDVSGVGICPPCLSQTPHAGNGPNPGCLGEVGCRHAGPAA
jgi:hypothetical protein